MGLLKALLKEVMKAATVKNFTPNFRKSEYDNWLDFVSNGGTTKKWETLKKQNGWKFRESSVERFQRYLKEVEPFSKPYYEYLTVIKKDWSIMYQSKDYHGEMAKKIETDCIDAINYYKEMKKIDEKYGEKTPTNIPPFERLALLYERQQRYEDCIKVCKEAYFYGMDYLTGRMKAAIKKAGRTPTVEETALIENNNIKS